MSSARRAPLFMWSVGMVVAGAVSVTVAACGSDGLSDGANNHGLDGAVVSGCSGAPQTACPCSSEGQAVDCGYVKEQSGNYLTCAAGSRTCAGGAWGPCVATGTVFQSLGPLGGDGNGGGGVHVESLGMNSDAGDAGDAGQTNCTDPCDPSCQTFVDNSNGVDGGPTVVPTEAGGWTLPGQTIDAASTCFVTLTGTVKDPAALNPVPNALVAIPFAGTPAGSGTPPALPTGVPLSDSCGGTAFSALRATLSASDGTFSLAGVPIQSAVTVVVQIGRWRRLVTLNTSACACNATAPLTPNSDMASCVTVTSPTGVPASTVPGCSGAAGDGGTNYAASANCLTRLPRKQTEGNVPHIAIATGGLDPEECTLYRMGVDVSEFTDENGTGRVHMFVNSVVDGSGGSTLPSPAANHDVSYLLGFTCPDSNCPSGTTPSVASIANNDFESAIAAPWTITGSPVAQSNGAAYSGSNSALLGDTSKKKQGTQTLSLANIVAPANAQSFQFYAQRHCGSSANGEGFSASLTDTTTNTTWSWSTSCHNGTSWLAYVASGTFTAGDKFTVTFTNTNPNNDTAYTYVDDVQWMVTASSLLDNYDLVMLPCNGGNEYGSSSWDANQGDNDDDPGRQNLVSYANVGGRIFTSHWGREWIERSDTTITNGPFPGVATWIDDINPGGNSAPAGGVINAGATWGAPFKAWMVAAGAANAAGVFTVNPWREDTTSVSSASRLFVTFDGTNGTTSGYPADFTFDTPLNASSQLGRAMFTDMHLASGTTNGNFPNNCPTQGSTLSAQEDAAEYLLFDLGNCVTGQPVPGALPPVITTGNGTNSVCSGGTSGDNKIEPSSCTTDADCEMDFHCSAGTCVWSQGNGYSDSTCTDANGNPAVDLTIGVPCAKTVGGTVYDIPICNRGTGTLAKGAVIKIANSGNGSNNSTWNCSGATQPNPPGYNQTCSYTLPVALGPGQCTDIDTSTTPSCGLLETGERYLYINYDQSIPECGTGFTGTGPGCMNNSTHTKATGDSSCPPVCGAGNLKVGTFTRDFQGVCPSGYLPVWHLFSWSGLTPSDSSLDFTAWTADTQAQLGVQYPTGAQLEPPTTPIPGDAGTTPTAAPDDHANGYIDGTTYSSDVDTKLIAAGYPVSGKPAFASHAWLRVVMTLSPSADLTAAPTVLAWKQSYDCVAAE